MALKQALAVVAILSALAAPARAAEVAVVSTLNIRPALDAMQAGFEARGQDRLAFTSQGAAATEALAASGAPADVVVGSRQMLERLAARGLVRPGSIVDIARSSIAVVVPAGARRPDVATDEALKRALLAAPRVAYPDPAKGSLGGNYLADLFRGWGLTEPLKPRLALTDGGRAAGDAAAEGKADLALNQTAELKVVPGLTFLEPLPPALTNKIVMSAAILARVRNADGAARWVRYMRSADAAAAIRANWMEP